VDIQIKPNGKYNIKKYKIDSVIRGKFDQVYIKVI
jgi:hypothetical protein